MIAEFGLAALWLAAALAGLQLLAGVVGLRDSGARIAALVRPAAVVQALLCALAFGALLLLFIRTDLSVALVARNSHSAKPFIFKLAGAWGNHEGSMLLWVSVMALAGGLIGLLERRLPERTMIATLAAQAFVGLGFYAFLLFSSNPFERLAQPPAEGMGLNPLLQDIGLAMHPPTLYMGYVGLSVAFSFAVGALLTRQVTPDFAKVMRPWVLGAWIFLTLGITAGSYWAYYELGWGGWWFWDPVENASLMPWLAATALLHSASVLASRDALRAWTIMLGVIAFSMSMLGTFLVRSGILTSVHAFAVDVASRDVDAFPRQLKQKLETDAGRGSGHHRKPILVVRECSGFGNGRARRYPGGAAFHVARAALNRTIAATSRNPPAMSLNNEDPPWSAPAVSSNTMAKTARTMG